MMRPEDGSLAPLGIGLAMISLATLLALASASSLFIFQRRLTTMAEFAALSSAAHGLSANDYLLRGFSIEGVRVAKDVMNDGQTHEVVFCAIWRSPVPLIFSVSPTEICGKGAARVG